MQTKEEDVVTTLFVANTHTPVLFFSSLGRVYKLKVFRLPLGTPQVLFRVGLGRLHGQLRETEAHQPAHGARPPA